jgi:thioredoxin reductase
MTMKSYNFASSKRFISSSRPNIVRTDLQMKEEKDSLKQVIDVAIVGGGPGGLQAALILARTRKNIIVFDDPEPARNAASHGVHGFLGLDGFLPTDIRKIAWKQIGKYNCAELREERITDIRKEDRGEEPIFLITNVNERSIKAKKVVLAVGYQDVYPDIPGFLECWADTVINCPYCDGYENKDRVWGIVVNSKAELKRYPKIAQNWTSKIKVFIPPNMKIEPIYQNELSRVDIPVHRGVITDINHTNSKVKSVTIDSEKKIEVDTLWWVPPRKPSPLTQRLVENLGLELDEKKGNIKTDEKQQTNVEGLFAVGDVAGSMGALGAAHDGGKAATSIANKWYYL